MLIFADIGTYFLFLEGNKESFFPSQGCPKFKILIEYLVTRSGTTHLKDLPHDFPVLKSVQLPPVVS